MKENESPDCKVFVAGLNYNTTEESLRKLMEKVGKVISYRILFDHNKQRSKGYGFVTYSTPEEAQRAIDELHHVELDGRYVAVKKYLRNETN